MNKIDVIALCQAIDTATKKAATTKQDQTIKLSDYTMSKKHFTIKKARFPQWGYEITGNNYHNIAPTIEQAKQLIIDRYGKNAIIRIQGEKST